MATAGFELRSNVLLQVTSHGAALEDFVPASARTVVDIAEGYGKRSLLVEQPAGVDVQELKAQRKDI